MDKCSSGTCKTGRRSPSQLESCLGRALARARASRVRTHVWSGGCNLQVPRGPMRSRRCAKPASGFLLSLSNRHYHGHHCDWLTWRMIRDRAVVLCAGGFTSCKTTALNTINYGHNEDSFQMCTPIGRPTRALEQLAGSCVDLTRFSWNAWRRRRRARRSGRISDGGASVASPTGRGLWSAREVDARRRPPHRLQPARLPPQRRLS